MCRANAFAISDMTKNNVSKSQYLFCIWDTELNLFLQFVEMCSLCKILRYIDVTTGILCWKTCWESNVKWCSVSIKLLTFTIKQIILYTHHETITSWPESILVLWASRINLIQHTIYFFSFTDLQTNIDFSLFSGSSSPFSPRQASPSPSSLYTNAL